MFRLDLDLPVPDTIRSAATRELTDARKHLQDAADRGQSRKSSVHEVRKDLKRIRSLLRLIRGDLPRRTYRRESRELREIQRSISAIRDAEVLVGTVDKLAGHFVGRLPEQSFEELRRSLAEDAARALGTGWRALAAEMALELDAALSNVKSWPLERCGLATLLDGAGESYERGRDAYRAASADPSTEALHDLRKRVKDHWYHQSLISDAWPSALRVQAKAAHELSDLLGDDHDLAVLSQALKAPAEPAPLLDDDIRALISERREELHASAMLLARRIYAEKPKAYRRRLRRYFQALVVEEPQAA